MTDSLSELVREIIAFRDQRDWGQFHSPRNLATALGIEVAELQEALLWKTDGEVQTLLKDGAELERLSDEIADILIYTLLFAHGVGIEPSTSIRQKLSKNALKYPIEKAKGNAIKYSEFNK